MIKNGTHQLVFNGNLVDFFSKMKTFILDVTNFQLIQSESLQLVFNTNINDIKMIIEDRILNLLPILRQ